MAELAASIITIALFGASAVKECKTYIDAVRKTDKLVDRLLRKVTDLHTMVCFLNSRYQQAEPDGASKLSLAVHEKITKCRNSFREIKSRVSELETRSSETFVDKVSLKRKMDTVAKDIEVAIDDIRQYLTEIALVAGTYSHLDSISHMRRASESRAAPSIAQGNSGEQLPQGNPSALDRWFPRAETILEPIHIRRDSNTTSPSRPSVSSLFSEAVQAQSDDESVLSAQTPVTLNPSEDWRDFHKTVLRCKDGSSLIGEVQSMLEQHPEPSALVNILGDHQRAPLHLAAMRGYVDLARILLAFGGDPHAKDTEPASVLDHALANKQSDFVALLLDTGVDETAILERNKDQLNKEKAVIAFRKKLEQGPAPEKTRKFSLSFRRNRSG